MEHEPAQDDTPQDPPEAELTEFEKCMLENAQRSQAMSDSMRTGWMGGVDRRPGDDDGAPSEDTPQT